jgi:tRNA dimethylallyltransferase
LTGPTASGKSAVGVALARRLNAELIALDSMTLYRGMDIGTAKPTDAERGGVPHHLIDVLEPAESASVALYREWALDVASSIEAKGKRVLFVGGTALYLKALLRGLFDGPAADPEFRRCLEDEADREGVAALHARLAMVDPISAARLHPNDRRRIIRALEVALTTGRPISSWQSGHETPAPASVAVFALERPRQELHRRIDARVIQMFETGLVEEVEELQPRLGPAAAQAVGYLEVTEMLANQYTLAETIARVQARTRQFSKRQSTWFRGLAEVQPWPVLGDEPPEATADRLFAAITGS